MRDDPSDLGLVEHHLGDEDRVRVARRAPGQITPVLAKPSQKPLVHREDSSQLATLAWSRTPMRSALPRQEPGTGGYSGPTAFVRVGKPKRGDRMRKALFLLTL